MSVWNPNAFTAHGEGVGAVVPSGLRVRGGVAASTAQMRAAQTVFANYCNLQRVSAGPNPQQLGSLPDGTPYRITTVGNTTNMEIWPVGGEVPKVRGGIGIVLVDLQGRMIPGHIHSDGDRPQPYLLTPGIQKDRQTTTGEWAVRKVNAFVGGKVVHRYKKTDRYITGVGGRHFALLPPQRPSDMGIGLVSRSLRYGSFGPRSAVYDNQKQVARSTDERDMVPFYRQDAKKRLWVMRLNIDLRSIHLFGNLYPVPNNEEIGDLIFTLDLPSGYVVADDSYTVSQDGNRLVFIANHPEGRRKVVVNIQDAKLVISSITPLPSVPYDVVTTKTEVIEQWDKNTVDTSESLDHLLTTTTTERTGNFSIEWTGYNLKGNLDSIAGNAVKNIETAIRESYIYYFEYNDPDLPGGSWIEWYKGTGRNSYTAFGYSNSDEGSEYAGSKNHKELVKSWDNLETVDNTGAHFIFYDQAYEINILYRIRRHVIIENGSTTETTSSDIVITKGNTEIFVMNMPNGLDFGYFACPSANDPLTGALCFNLLQFSDPQRVLVTRSWIFVVDDQGIKPLSQIMNIPAGSSVRIQSDSTLMCV